MKDGNIVKARDLLTAEMGNEVVMMDPVEGKYYNLGTIGGEIWSMLSDPITEAEIVNDLVKIYEVSEEQCQAEVTSFISNLVERGLIKIVEQG